MSSQCASGDRRARPAAVLRSLGSRNLLFSEADQAIYEVDASAALLLREFDPRLGSDEVPSGRLHEFGNESPLAALPLARRPAAGASLVLELAGVAVQLNLPPELLAEAEPVFAQLKSSAAEAHGQIGVRADGDRVKFLHAGLPASSCARAEFVPMLKCALIEEVLRHAAYEVAVHTAALLRNDRLLLLSGSPGAGKTTLAMALTRAGFEMAADDVVLVHDDGRATGVALPFAAKSGSWPLIGGEDELAALPSHRRPDGQIVRYVHPESAVRHGRYRIGSIMLLDRSTDGEAHVRDIDPTDALAQLIGEGTSRDERLTAAGFEALVAALNNARCCRLTYSDLDGAVAALSELHS